MTFSDDFQPEPADGEPVGYSSTMTGTGSWAELFTAAGKPLGVLWTNKTDSVGLYPVPNADDDAANETRRVIAANGVDGYPAGDMFAYLVNQFTCDVYGGNLGELADKLEALTNQA